MSTIIVLGVVVLLMIAEAIHAARNERALLARGAIEPAGDVYRTMRWAYPLCFVSMASEGIVFGPPARSFLLAGLATFALAKALKYWAIAALGSRWTFRVIVLPSTPLVVTGPYAFMRHPNYVAVLGELAGAALTFGALVTGVASIAAFGWLMLRRIAVEDHALGRAE
jgi:methyltransferase